MKNWRVRQQFFLFLLIILLAVGLTSCGAHTGDLAKNDEIHQTSRSEETTPSVSPEPSLVGLDPSELFGCWGGTGGGLMIITASTVADGHSGEIYSFSLKERIENDGKVSYLLSLEDHSNDSYLKAFELFTLLEKDRFAYYGFDSESDYKSNSFSAAGDFFRQDCKTMQ